MNKDKSFFFLFLDVYGRLKRKNLRGPVAFPPKWERMTSNIYDHIKNPQKQSFRQVCLLSIHQSSHLSRLMMYICSNIRQVSIIQKFVLNCVASILPLLGLLVHYPYAGHVSHSEKTERKDRRTFVSWIQSLASYTTNFFFAAWCKLLTPCNQRAEFCSYSRMSKELAVKLLMNGLNSLQMLMLSTSRSTSSRDWRQKKNRTPSFTSLFFSEFMFSYCTVDQEKKLKITCNGIKIYVFNWNIFTQ